jgi:hypothetical protein
VKAQNGEILVLPHPHLLSSPCSGDPMEISIGVMISIFLVIIIALSAFMLYREFSQVNGRVGKLEENSAEKSLAIQGLEERMKKLETANRKRMPWDALEKLLNARAAINIAKEEHQVNVNILENAESWIEQVMATGTNREEK